MIENERQLRASLEQLGRLLRGLADLKATVLPKNPRAFATFAESCCEDIDRIRQEIEDYLSTSRTMGNAGASAGSR